MASSTSIPDKIDMPGPPAEGTVADGAAALAKLQAYMANGPPQAGMISDLTVTAGDTETHPSDPGLMRKVCIAFCDLNHMVPDERGAKRPATWKERLDRVQCPVELYLQMVQNPEFRRLLNRTATELITLPQLPQIQAALSTKAATVGDEKSARMIYEISKLLELETKDEIRRQYASLDDTAFRRRLREECTQTLAMLDQVEGTSAPPPAAALEAQATVPLVEPERPDMQTLIGGDIDA